MIGAQSPKQKSTVRGEIVLGILAAHEEFRRKAKAEKEPFPIRLPIGGSGGDTGEGGAEVDEEEEVYPAEFPNLEISDVKRESELKADEVAGNGERHSEKVAGISEKEEEVALITEEMATNEEGTPADADEITGNRAADPENAEEIIESAKEAYGSAEEILLHPDDDSGSVKDEDPDAVVDVPSESKAVTSDPAQASFDVPKHPYDYLREPIPMGEASAAFLRERCYPVIGNMSVHSGSTSKTRRAKLDRIFVLVRGYLVQPPPTLLRRVLAQHGVDARELDRIVQRCLIVTEDHRDRVDAWLAKLGRWMRRILKSDGAGKAWLARAVEHLREQRRKAELAKAEAKALAKAKSKTK